MPCPDCQGNGRRNSSICPTCLGSGSRHHRGANPPVITIMGPVRRRDRGDGIRALLARISTSADGPTRRAVAEHAIDEWLDLGDIGEARCIARDFAGDLTDEYLIKADAQDELRARQVARLMCPVPTDDADAFDEIDRLAHWSEMPGGTR